jgi:hypothetical protein
MVEDAMKIGQVEKVGIFHATYIGSTLDGHRWKCLNTKTCIHHFTYGSWGEVEAMLTRQDAAWKRASLPGKTGDAWRAKDFRTRKGEKKIS